MSSLSICDMDGKNVGTVEVSDVLLDTKRGGQVVRDAIVAFRANQRLGTASTKTKGEVAGNGQKPWRQKGTGNARAGYRQSPIWRGGGVVFGPKPRSFNKDLNRKMLRLALAKIVADRISEKAVMVLDKLELPEAKTKAFIQSMKKLNIGRGALIVSHDVNNSLLLASRNVPGIEIARATHVNVYQIARYPRLVITKDALDILQQRATGSKETVQ